MSRKYPGGYSANPTDKDPGKLPTGGSGKTKLSKPIKPVEKTYQMYEMEKLVDELFEVIRYRESGTISNEERFKRSVYRIADRMKAQLASKQWKDPRFVGKITHIY